MARERYQTRLAPDHAELVDQFAEDRDISQSEAVRRLILNGLEEESEDNQEPEKPVPDGGFLRPDKHPWVKPLMKLGERAAALGIVFITLGFFPISVTAGAMDWFGVELSAQTAAITLSLFLHLSIIGGVFGLLSAISLLALEYLMHPTEAPIRRYFPRTWPEEYREHHREVTA